MTTTPRPFTQIATVGDLVMTLRLIASDAATVTWGRGGPCYHEATYAGPQAARRALQAWVQAVRAAKEGTP
jgi:hypothetical protein